MPSRLKERSLRLSFSFHQQKKLQKMLRQSNRFERRLSRFVENAPLGVLQRLLEGGGSLGDLSDIDADGIPDALEKARGFNLCNDDSDGDGISDGDEVKEGKEADEVEVIGTLTALSSTSLTVKGEDNVETLYALSQDTAFYDGAPNYGKLTLSDFAVGNYVKVMGEVDNSGTLIAVKVKKTDKEHDHDGHEKDDKKDHDHEKDGKSGK